MITVRRPKLKSDTAFLPMEDGVFIQSDTSACLLKGKTAYRWLATLSPYLNGEHTLDELCASLGSTQRETVARLVSTLHQRGVLVDHTPEEPLLARPVLERFRSQIAFIDHFADQPQARFQRFRRGRVLLTGAGVSYLALASTLLRNGLEHINLATANPAPYLRALEPLADELRAQEIAVELETPGTPDSLDLASYDLVAYCADAGSLYEVARLNERCLQAGTPFLPAVIWDGRALVGPLVEPDRGPCWLCAALRLGANHPSAALWQSLALPTPLPAAPAPVGDIQATMVGNGLGFELFKAIAGHLPTDAKSAVIIQDLTTLASRRAPLHAHPLCPACGAAERSATTTPPPVPTDDQEEIFKRLEPLVDPDLGLFRAFVDEERTQIPLKSTALTYGAPGASDSDTTVYAYSAEHLLDARITALKSAIGRYSARLPRRQAITWATADDLRRRGVEAIDPERLSTWSGADTGAGRSIAWIAARSLSDGRGVYVPAAAVYPDTDLNTGLRFERTAAGLGVGHEIGEAANEGLRSLLAFEKLQALVAGRAELRPVSLTALADDQHADLRFLARSLTPFEVTATLAEVVGDAPVALSLAAATTPQGDVSATGVGATRTAALTNSLSALIGRLQATLVDDQAADDLDAPLPDLIDWVRRPADANSGAPAAELPGDPLAWLRTQGRESFLTEITTDDVGTTGTFVACRVLITRPDPHR